MHLRETAAQTALRKELRSYFADVLPEAERGPAAESGVGGDRFREVTARLGRDGRLGMGWPREYGGQARSIEDQFVFFDEVQRAGLPFPFVTINTVGPTLMRHGTAEQKRRFLPGILAGETVFAIGYTEPEAGTDLASLRTRAVREGDGFTVNGHKVFTSGGNTADYIWLACRTDPDAPPHRGISILIVPTDDPGFSWSPIRTMGGLPVTATYYDDIHVAEDALVGGLNEGWGLITMQLNHERVGLAALGGRMIRLWEQVLGWAKATSAIERPWVRAELARCHARLEAMRLMNWKMTAAVAEGTVTGAAAGAAKTYGTETHVAVLRSLTEVLGAAGRIRPGAPAAVLAGQVEQLGRHALVNTFGGGVNDVLREMVATQGLGLPRAGRRA